MKILNYFNFKPYFSNSSRILVENLTNMAFPCIRSGGWQRLIKSCQSTPGSMAEQQSKLRRRQLAPNLTLPPPKWQTNSWSDPGTLTKATGNRGYCEMKDEVKTQNKKPFKGSTIDPYFGYLIGPLRSGAILVRNVAEWQDQLWSHRSHLIRSAGIHCYQRSYSLLLWLLSLFFLKYIWGSILTMSSVTQPKRKNQSNHYWSVFYVI